MIEIRRFDDYEAIRISSIPEPTRSAFLKWLGIKSVPLVEGPEHALDWAYVWDWWKFCRQ